MLLDLFSRFDLGTNVIYKAYPIRRLASIRIIFIWAANYWLVPSPFNLALNGVVYRLSTALIGPRFRLGG